MMNYLFRLALLLLFQSSFLLAEREAGDANAFKAIDKFQNNITSSQWFAWKVDMVPGHGKVCCSYWHSSNGNSSPSVCNLDDNLDDNKVNSIQVTNNQQEGDSGLIVYFKVAKNKAPKIKAVSNSCHVNTGKNEVIWLNNISGKNSVAFILRQANDIDNNIQQSKFIEALAYHQDKAATDGLIALHQKYGTEQKQHVELMLTSLRGEVGLNFVMKQFDSQSSLKQKEERIFSISQSPLAKAQKKIVDIARYDKSNSLRKNATFWLSQMDIENSAELIMQLITKEKSSAVKSQAVFALGQVSNGEGLPYLEKLIRHSKDNQVRQQALFWLTQSDEERAMPILESILGG